MLADSLTLLGDTGIDRQLISRRGTEFPSNPQNGDIFQLTQNSVTHAGKTPGIYLWSAAKNDWLVQTDEEKSPYDMAITIVGRPKPDAIVAQAVMSRTMILLANLNKSKAIAQTAPTSNAVFKINQVDIDGNIVQELGSITFAAGSKLGTVTARTSNTEMILAEGEIISIKAPLVRDATLKEISITLAGRLAVLND